MTTEQLNEGKRLQDLINSFNLTLIYFEEMDKKKLKEELANFLTKVKTVPNKDQMALVMLEAAIESCKTCIEAAQEKFDSL